MGFPGGSAGRESTCNVGDLGSVSGLGRSPGEGNSSLLQYSGLENSKDCIVHGVAKSRITTEELSLSSNPSPGHTFRQNDNSKRYRDPCVCNHIIHNSQDREATWMSISRGTDKEAVAGVCRGIVLSRKKNEIVPFEQHRCNWRLSY